MTVNPIGSDDPVEVAKGGTGLSTVTAYAVMCGGTTATGPLQQVSGTGTGGDVLTSNGAGMLPTWQTPSYNPGVVYVDTQTASADTAITFDGFYGTGGSFLITGQNISAGTNGVTLVAEISTNNGASWVTSGYASTFFYFDSVGSGRSSSTANGTLSRASDFSSTNAGDFNINFVDVFMTNQAAIFVSSAYYSSTNTAFSGGFGWTTCPTAAQITSIRFRMSSGTITGKAEMYVFKSV